MIDKPPEGLVTRRTVLAVPALLLPFAADTASAQEQARPAKPLDAPYIPTEMPIVRKMLEMGKVNRNDTLYDLGCGDGRIVITAAKERGARGVGIDIDPQRIDEANENAKQAGVSHRVKFIVGDLFAANLAPATVVTLYLLPAINMKLRPRLWRQLRPGTRVVSHAFDMGEDWPPEDMQNLRGTTIYRWTIRPEHKSVVRPIPRK
jgi:SAM-dependent methyltransferase